MLEAALNGDRDHPALPRTPPERAAEGRAAVDAGALVLHLHPYDDSDAETFAEGLESVNAFRWTNSETDTIVPLGEGG